MKIPITISARHIHLSEKDTKKLFGKNYKLKPLKEVTQPGQFATKETLTIANKKNKIENVRIIIPERLSSQIEISITDAFKLKIKCPKKITVIGPKGKIKIPAIVSQRHLHVSETEAKKLKLKKNQKVKIKVKGKRAIIFENVLVRIHKNFKLYFHVDTDEGNAAGINKKAFGELIK